MNWLEVTAYLAEEPQDWAPWIDMLLGYGCPNTLQGDFPPSITACIPVTEGAENTVEEMRKGLLEAGAESVQVREVPEQDWTEFWKQHFKIQRIGERFVVVPSWETYEAREGDIVLSLDPGQAFGTGDHPTTRMCLRLLEKIGVEGKSLLDIGCGSGILSIGACRLGANPILAVDIEPISVEISRENATANGVEFEVMIGDGVESLRERGEFDVVVSNIISATLIAIAPDVVFVCKPNGLWVVSGIYEGNWQDVLKGVQRFGFVLEQLEREDQWVAAVFRRTA